MTAAAMTGLTGRTVVVAGNGVSLEQLMPGVILDSDFIIRTNNFFLERTYYLGTRVDLAVMGGDPRVAPFMFETLHRCRADYDLRAWTSLNPRVSRAGMRRFSAQHQPFPWRDARLKADTLAIEARFGRKAMTGTYAMLAAYGLGAPRIILVGLDLYGAGPRYPFPMGPNQRALMAPVINARGIDTDQHDRRLDSAILDLLIARGDVEILATKGMAWSGVLPQAPLREGQALAPRPRPHGPKDWTSRIGLYHIRMLRALRWLRRTFSRSKGT